MKTLLSKLEPMAMMEEGGPQKAAIACNVLVSGSAAPGSAKALAEANGVRLMIQTMLLHPDPTLRQGAAVVLTRSAAQNDPDFLAVALREFLPAALVRVLAETDRRAKAAPSAEGGETDEAAAGKAVDPDLPVRIEAFGAFEYLLLHAPLDVTAAALDTCPGLLVTALELCVNTGLELRKRGALLLQQLLQEADEPGPRARRMACLEALHTTIEGQSDKVAQWLASGVCDEDTAVSGAASAALLSLTSNATLRNALRDLDGFVNVLRGMLPSTEPISSADGALPTPTYSYLLLPTPTYSYPPTDSYLLLPTPTYSYPSASSCLLGCSR